jgi:hypothetical protein
MSFTITIRDVADKDLGSLIASLKLPKGVDYRLTHMIDVRISAADPSIIVNGKKRRKKKSRRGNPDIKLTMSGKRPMQPGSKIEKGIELFEKLEADMGIGTVSANAFSTFLRSKHVNGGMLSRLTTEGYLNYL